MQSTAASTSLRTLRGLACPDSHDLAHGRASIARDLAAVPACDHVANCRSNFAN
jgi:hypothetical protein